MGSASATTFIDLPVEILERIIEFLPRYQRAVLLRTCRTLSHPCFWQHTYRTVSLYDTKQLHDFGETMELSPNGYSKLCLGEYVRHLTLWDGVLSTDNDMVKLLQQQCPSVECVQLTTGSNNKIPPFKIFSNGWHKLTTISSSHFDDWEESLTVYRHQLKHLAVHKAIDLDSISSLPYLTHFDYRSSTIIHSIDEMDQINRTCPALQLLHIGDLEVALDYDDMVKTMATPATVSSLTHLSVGDIYISDPAMYQIFGVLYPNLVSLKIQHILAKPISPIASTGADRTWHELDSDQGDDDYDFDFNRFSLQQIDGNSSLPPHHQHIHTWASIAQSLNQMMANLPCLRQLSLPSIGVSPCNDDLSTSDLWLQRCAQLEDIRLDWYCKNFKTRQGYTDKQPEPKWERVSHLLNLCNTTVQAWYMFLKHDPISLQRIFFEQLAHCTWLHSLTIYTTYESDATIPIDELLTCLPHLKSLELRTKFGKDLLSPIEKTAPRLRSLVGTTIKLHGLTRFVYIGKLFSSRLVAYVHARCPKLSILHLDCRQTPSRKTIDLHLTGLRLLELDIGSEFNVGKMVKTVLVQEMSYSPPKSRWFQFSRGAWYRQRQINHSQSPLVPAVANLTITCDYVERCIFKPQAPCFIQTS